MTLTLIDTEDFAIDPGIEVMAGTLAVQRIWQPAGNWRARFGGDTGISWAYMDNRGPTGGLDQTASWIFYLRHYIGATMTASANAAGLIGLHTDPSIAGVVAPDAKNFMGYRIRCTVANNVIIEAYALDENGAASVGNTLSFALASFPDFRIDVSYNAATRALVCTVRRYSDLLLLGTSSITLPGGFVVLPMTMFATRDGQAGAAAYTVDGYLDDILLQWSNPPDDWLLHARDYGIVVLNHTGLWNKDQQPRDTIISAEGRNWDNVYHDGAGPAMLELKGTLLRDTPAELDVIRDLMFQVKAEGRVVDVYAPSSETLLTLKNGKVKDWSYPRNVFRQDNRDFMLLVQSRRQPDII